MNQPRDGLPQRAALKIAGGYAIFGGLWILFSDRIVLSLAATEAQLTLLQTLKGAGFVLLSAVGIFALVSRAVSRLTATMSELEVSHQQVSRLHRILRHNLRNSCQVIAGNAALLEETLDKAQEPYLSDIQRHNDRLISLSRKSIYLHDFLEVGPGDTSTVDLVATVEKQAEQVDATYPEATILVDGPDQAHAQAHHRIDGAVEELLENAIIHNDSSDPHVWVTIQADANTVSLTVADNGPGIPPVEREVLQRRTETPTVHSQGLGLWLVYLTVTYSGGSLTISDSHRGGDAVEVTVPTP